MVRTLCAAPVVLMVMAGAAVAQEQPKAPAPSPTAAPPASPAQPASPAVADRPRPGIAAGASIAAKAKGFKLTNAEGKPVRLEELYAKGPLVVVFHYGTWSPMCVKNLVAWQQELEAFRALGAEVVAVSPESSERAAQAQDNHLLEFPLLTDTDGAAVRAFELLIKIPEDKRRPYLDRGVDIGAMNACGCWEVPIPAAFVIDGEGVVRAAIADWDPKKRPDPRKVLEFVREMDKGGGE